MTPDMMDSWMSITGATDAAYMVTADDTGYHLRVMATYTDTAGTDTAMEYSMPTMMVTAVDEMMGEVTLWAGAGSPHVAPQVGDTITGAVMDPDGGVTGESWQWSRTMDTADMSRLDGHPGRNRRRLHGDGRRHGLPPAGDGDEHGRGGTDTAMEYSMPTMMVTAVDETQPADFDPLAKYDADKSGRAREGRGHPGHQRLPIRCGADAISKDDVIETINLYLFG